MATTGKRTITLTTALWLVLMTTIVVIVAFCHFPDGADWKWCIPLEGSFHIPMMLAGAALVGLIAFVCFKCCKGSEIRRGRLLAVSGIVTVVQIVLMYSYYVHTNWDVQQVTGVAKAMATGGDIDEFSSYFKWNPNNLFLSRIFAAVFFLTGPLWGMKVTLFPLLVLQSVGACLTALMLVQTAMHIWHRKDCAILTYVLYLLLVWMSPWSVCMTPARASPQTALRSKVRGIRLTAQSSQSWRGPRGLPCSHSWRASAGRRCCGGSRA